MTQIFWMVAVIIVLAIGGYGWIVWEYRRQHQRMRRALAQHDANFSGGIASFFASLEPLRVAYDAAETDEEREWIRVEMQRRIDRVAASL